MMARNLRGARNPISEQYSCSALSICIPNPAHKVAPPHEGRTAAINHLPKYHWPIFSNQPMRAQ
jgi:hypothetical protein